MTNKEITEQIDKEFNMPWDKDIREALKRSFPVYKNKKESYQGFLKHYAGFCRKELNVIYKFLNRKDLDGANIGGGHGGSENWYAKNGDIMSIELGRGNKFKTKSVKIYYA